MRAYMSDRSERSERTVDAGTMGDLGVAWNALAEARAILAETEPGGWDGTQSTAEPYRRPTYHPQDADTALAESLARFIQAEV